MTSQRSSPSPDRERGAAAAGGEVGLLLLSLFLSACAERGCSPLSTPSRADASSQALAQRREAALCRREVAHASVGVPPGAGAIDAVVPTCDEASRSLTLWVLRGHTLSVLTRSLDAGATFAPPREVSTGADQLGALGSLSARGPAAWRSPTSGIEDLDRDEWWAAVLDPSPGSAEAGPLANDGALRVLRGSVRMPEGVVGLGVLAPWGPPERDGSLELLGTVAREGAEPSLARVGVSLGADARVLDAPPEGLAVGELKSFEAQGRVALVYAVAANGTAELRALDMSRTPPVVIGAHPLSHHHVLVVSRGVHRAGLSLFAATEFDVTRPERGPCISLDAALCVAPGPPLLLVADPAAGALRVWRAGESALVDALATDPHDGRAVLLTLGLGDTNAGEHGTHTQRVTHVDPAQGNPETYTLALTSELPPLDRPALVECGGQLWLSAELSVGAPVESEALPLDVRADDAARGPEEPPAGARERAVLALPFACARRAGR